MKYIYWSVAFVIFLLLTAFTIGQVDATYQTVKHSVDSLKQRNEALPLVSPNRKQFHILVNNHWRISPVFSDLEDVFYPVRQWNDHIGHALKYSGTYHQLQNQLKGMVMVEKATKVRAMRAYFFAKRRNFKDQALNNDFINKDTQWRAIFTNVIQRKVNLINGSYNNQWLVVVVIGIVFIGLLFLIKATEAMVALLGLVVALLMGSFYQVIELGVPFHWFLIAWLLLFSANQRVFNHQNIMHYMAFGIPLLVASSSTIGLLVGIGAMQLIWSYPRCKRFLYFLFWIHPFGAWYVIQKERKMRPLIMIWGMAFGVIFGLKLLGVHLLLTSPIAYLGQVGIIVNAVLLMMVSACLLDDDTGVNNRTKLRVMFVAMVVVVLIKEFLNTPLFGWSFSFLWNPMIQWGSIIGICTCLIKKGRVTSSDDQVV